MQDKPYFMQNKEWFVKEWDDEEMEFKWYLTDKAPPEAEESFKEFFSEQLEKDDEGIQQVVYK